MRFAIRKKEALAYQNHFDLTVEIGSYNGNELILEIQSHNHFISTQCMVFLISRCQKVFFYHSGRSQSGLVRLNDPVNETTMSLDC